MNRRPLVRRARRRLFPLQFEAMERRLLLTTFVVTSTADSGLGPLRQAILDVDADSTPGDTIDFSIASAGFQIIYPRSALPEITNSVTINGTSQPGYTDYPLIVIDGISAGLGANGLTISAGSSTVQGLDIVEFFGNGIDLNSNGDDVIDSCIIGTYQDLNFIGNAGNGVEISSFSDHNTIGGTTPEARNLISGNIGDGILITYSDYNLVQGNYIGTKVDGTKLLSNFDNGVEISSFSDYNTIGGTTSGAGNVISGNAGDGVRIFESNDNLVLGNSIGTDYYGTQLLNNAGNGVEISFSDDNTIGGTTPGAFNFISGNDGDGVLITHSDDNLVLGNSIGTDYLLGNAGNGVEISGSVANTIGGLTATPGTGAGNVISANELAGLLIQGFESEDNLVEGNLIGTDYSGTEALGNIQGGISIGDAATNNTVGGTTPEARNIISGNFGDGVSIIGTAVGPNTTDNLVLGNYIGTDVTGKRPLGNNGNGVSIIGAPGNSEGLFTPVAFNLISGNGQNGIAISNVQRPSNGGPFGSLVVGNFIGTDVFGSLPLGNGGDGILLDTAASTTIGGTTPAARNILSGNSAAGVEISGGDSISNLVEGNYIGTDTTGTAALANLVGVFINGAPGNTIGGTTPSAINVISGNSNAAGSGVGVQILGSGATRNLVEGNYIGTDHSGGFPLGNDTGVFINGAAANTIGGTVQGAGNVIAGYTTSAALLSIQGGVGVDIANAGASDNLVEGNLIGTDATGKRALVPSQQPASGVGVLINNTPGSNTIGGVTAAARNVISGFVIAIEIYAPQSSSNPEPGTTVEGNYIGTNALGVVVAGLGNTTGIFVNGVPSNTIGGTATGDRNVIAGNTTGIYLLGPTTSGNLVQGNYIGLDPTGTSAEPNLTGIFVNDAMNNMIGGTAPGAGNVIAGNLLVGQVGSTGIYFYAGAAGNLVQSNLIGTNASGKTGKNLGLGDYGILLYNAPRNTYPTSGKGANTIRGSGIAATREYSSGDPLATTSGTTSKGKAKSVPSGPRALVRRPRSRK